MKRNINYPISRLASYNCQKCGKVWEQWIKLEYRRQYAGGGKKLCSVCKCEPRKRVQTKPTRSKSPQVEGTLLELKQRLRGVLPEIEPHTHTYYRVENFLLRRFLTDLDRSEITLILNRYEKET